MKSVVPSTLFSFRNQVFTNSRVHLRTYTDTGKILREADKLDDNYKDLLEQCRNKVEDDLVVVSVEMASDSCVHMLTSLRVSFIEQLGMVGGSYLENTF